MVKDYKVVTLCGSTRFKKEFMEAQKQLTLQGCIVLSVGLFGHSGDQEVWENMSEGTRTKTKEMLDDMHKRKIDMADEIFVLNVNGYIGESTASEIAYAKAHNKIVRYLEEERAQIQLVDYCPSYMEDMRRIFNEIIEEGGSVPFLDPFTPEQFQNFLNKEEHITVALKDNKVVGMAMVHADLPGRCSSIANADYSIAKEYRGQHIGEQLVLDSLDQARKLGYRLMKFNGVVDTNVHARHLYERCGFKEVGVIPEGFMVKDGTYQDMHIYIKEL